VKDLARKRWVTSRRSAQDRRTVCLRLSRKGAALQATDRALQRGKHNPPMNSQSADLLERLGGIIETGQLIASNTTH
jgi:DNA-binding MarR family transcriptional regulator